MIMKKYLILTLMTLSSICTNARFNVDGFFYDFNGENTVCVSWHDQKGYTGIINIPDSICHNGFTYSVTAISNSAFSECKWLVSVTIPESVTFIDAYAFKSSSISSVIIGNNVSSIGYMAFYGCTNLKSLTIGSGMQSIGLEAFNGCVELENVYCLATTCPSSSNTNTFINCNLWNATLHVPAKSVRQYQAHEIWGQFINIVPLTREEEGITADPILTIQQAEAGTISTIVPKGSVYTFSITPCKSWKIHSVTFNDVDITNQLSEENKFTTPAITTNSTLSVVYELDDIDEVRAISESDVTIQGTSYGARVIGANKGDVIRIYTTDGSLYHSAKAEQQVVDVPLKKDNVYIVKVGTRTMKLSH